MDPDAKGQGHCLYVPIYHTYRVLYNVYSV